MEEESEEAEEEKQDSDDDSDGHLSDEEDGAMYGQLVSKSQVLNNAPRKNEENKRSKSNNFNGLNQSLLSTDYLEIRDLLPTSDLPSASSIVNKALNETFEEKNSLSVSSRSTLDDCKVVKTIAYYAKAANVKVNPLKYDNKLDEKDAEIKFLHELIDVHD